MKTYDYKFVIFLLLFSMSLKVESKAMEGDNKEFHIPSPMGKNLLHHTKMPGKIVKKLFHRAGMPEEIAKKILCPLQTNGLFYLRSTSKGLKSIIDKEYWKLHEVNIRAKSSFPVIQEVKDIPFATAFFSFEKWKQNDIEQLLYFECITNLRLEGLKIWDFSTGELFNPTPCSPSYYIPYIIPIINFFSLNILGMEFCPFPIFANVTFLDLSNSQVGAYGVICFVSHFRKLRTLNISNNDIGLNKLDEASAIANMTTLTSLNISKNHFSSLTVKEIDQLTNLTFLDISYNFISDDFIIRKLRELPKIMYFKHINQKQEPHRSL